MPDKPNVLAEQFVGLHVSSQLTGDEIKKLYGGPDTVVGDPRVITAEEVAQILEAYDVEVFEGHVDLLKKKE